MWYSVNVTENVAHKSLFFKEILLSEKVFRKKFCKLILAFMRVGEGKEEKNKTFFKNFPDPLKTIAILNL